MLSPGEIAEIRRRFVECPGIDACHNDLDALLADREELVRRLAKAEAELEGLREIATSGPSTAAGPSPLSHRAAPVEDA